MDAPSPDVRDETDPAASPSELAAVLDHLPALVLVWDRDLHLWYANAPVGEWYGVPVRQLIGRHLADIAGADVLELNLPYLRAALAGRTQRFERTLADASGHVRYVQVVDRPYLRDGEPWGVLGLVTDISDRIRTQVRQRAATDRISLLDQRRRIAAGLSARRGTELASLAGRLRAAARDGADVADAEIDAIDAVILGLRESIKALREAAAGPATPSAFRDALGDAVSAAAPAFDRRPTLAVAEALGHLGAEAMRATTEALGMLLAALAAEDPAMAVDLTVRTFADQLELHCIGRGDCSGEEALRQRTAGARYAAEQLGGSLSAIATAAGEVSLDWRIPARPVVPGSGASGDDPVFAAWTRPSALAAGPAPDDAAVTLARPAGAARGRGAATGRSGPELISVLDQIPAVVTSWDGRWRNLFANAAAVGWFGREHREQVLGRPITELIAPDIVAANLPYAEATRSGHAQSFTRSVSTPDGGVRHMQVSYLPRRVDGTVDGMYVLVTDVTARVRAEQDMQADIGRSAALAERSRVAEDLHDLVVQHLYAAQLTLSAGAVDAAERARRLLVAAASVDAARADLLRCTAELERGRADGGLEQQVRTIASRVLLDVELTVGVDAAAEGMPPEVRRELLAVVNEALSNVSRHAMAGRAAVDVTRDGPFVRLTVRDDGAGLDPDAPAGNGLANMRARARRLGGDLVVEAGATAGTVLSWTAALPAGAAG